MLSVLLMSLICKRFEEGRKPYTALQLKSITNIPSRIVHDLLNDLTEVGLITNVSNDEKGKDPVYQPALTTSTLSVGSVIDRLEARGKWKLDLDIRQLDSTLWTKSLQLRTDYLKEQREILLKDL